MVAITISPFFSQVLPDSSVPYGQYHMVKPRKILYDAFHVILHIQ